MTSTTVADRLNVILTSYNRPYFLRRALESLLAQSDPAWRCWLMDDNSDEATRAVIRQYQHEPRLLVRLHETTEAERQAATRYSVLINQVLAGLSGGVVGFMCDNVAYHPELVATVRGWFANGGGFAGYVPHKREAWTEDGRKLGDAEYYRHWNITPPAPGPIAQPAGLLDHSQVFHRLPVTLRWPEQRRYVKRGDAVYFTALVSRYGPIAQMGETCLTTEALFS